MLCMSDLDIEDVVSDMGNGWEGQGLGVEGRWLFQLYLSKETRKTNKTRMTCSTLIYI